MIEFACAWYQDENYSFSFNGRSSQPREECFNYVKIFISYFYTIAWKWSESNFNTVRGLREEIQVKATNVSNPG